MWDLAKLKGNKRVLDVFKDAEGNYVVRHIESGELAVIDYNESRKKPYRLVFASNRRFRYLSKDVLEINYVARKIMGARNADNPGLRASVESTINQVFCGLRRGGKVAYRGLVKCSWYVLSRAMMTNMKRIMAYDGSLSGKQKNEVQDLKIA